MEQWLYTIFSDSSEYSGYIGNAMIIVGTEHKFGFVDLIEVIPSIQFATRSRSAAFRFPLGRPNSEIVEDLLRSCIANYNDNPLTYPWKEINLNDPKNDPRVQSAG